MNNLTSSAPRIGNLIHITPFFSLLILHLVIGEDFHPATFGGLLLIVGSILFQGGSVGKHNLATRGTSAPKPVKEVPGQSTKNKQG